MSLSFSYISDFSERTGIQIRVTDGSHIRQAAEVVLSQGSVYHEKMNNFSKIDLYHDEK